jgi:PIN domain nuclease of toxin-antitoxin system
MRYYLDTNILVFIIAENRDDISIDVSEILADYGNTFYASSVAIKELILLYKSGRVKFKRKMSEREVLDTLSLSGIETIFFNEHHLSEYMELCLSEGHKDMNDHAIIAQSISDKIPLISSDMKFHDYVKQGLDFTFNKR